MLPQSLPIVSLAKPTVKVQYICEMKQDIPITYARTPTETVEFIGWQSQAFSNSGYTPERRCQEVTARFQKHSDAGNLRFITTGRMNNQNVMCVAQKKEVIVYQMACYSPLSLKTIPKKFL